MARSACLVTPSEQPAVAVAAAVLVDRTGLGASATPGDAWALEKRFGPPDAAR